MEPEKFDRIPNEDEILTMNLMKGEPIISYTFNLNAIWLNKAIITSKGRTCRIMPDMQVRIEDSQLVDIEENKPATHSILKCRGMISSHFIIFVQRLIDCNIEMIKI